MKTGWKDDIFEGNRKFNLIEHEDHTVSLVDVTEYAQKGDAFGAMELDEIGKEFNRAQKTLTVTLTAAGWTGTAAPYSQTVTVSDAKESMEPILVSALADGATLEEQKAYSKAFGLVSCGTASVGDGTATFKVYKKPITDIVVGLKGV